MSIFENLDNDDAPDGRLSVGLLILRVTLGLFLLQWAGEKFVLPQVSSGIFSHFYGFDASLNLTYLVGAAEAVLALGILLGVYRRLTYGIGFLIHAVSVLATWRYLIDPYGLIWGEVQHLFAAGVPVLAGFLLLYMARHKDVLTLDGRFRAPDARFA